MRLMIALIAALTLAGCLVAPAEDGTDGAAEASSPESAVEDDVPTTSVTLEGYGGVSTDPFVLDAGHYLSSWEVDGPCIYNMMLKPLGDQPSGSVRVAAIREGNRVGAGNVYDVAGGEWYLDATGAKDCPWTLTLEPR